MNGEKRRWHEWCFSPIRWYNVKEFSSMANCELVMSKLTLAGTNERTIDRFGSLRYTRKTTLYLPSKQQALEVQRIFNVMHTKIRNGCIIKVDDDCKDYFVGQTILFTLIRISCGSANTSCFLEIFKLQSKLKFLESATFTSFLVNDHEMLVFYIQLIKIVTDISNSLIDAGHCSSIKDRAGQVRMMLSIAICTVNVLSSRLAIYIDLERVFTVILEFLVGEVTEVYCDWTTRQDESERLDNISRFLKVGPCDSMKRFLEEFKWVAECANSFNRSESYGRYTFSADLMNTIFYNGDINPKYREVLPRREELRFTFAAAGDLNDYVLYVFESLVVKTGGHIMDNLKAVPVIQVYYEMISHNLRTIKKATFVDKYSNYITALGYKTTDDVPRPKCTSTLIHKTTDNLSSTYKF